eukprot:1349836-Pleurochrysis_carterae.AAC.1
MSTRTECWHTRRKRLTRALNLSSGGEAELVAYSDSDWAVAHSTTLDYWLLRYVWWRRSLLWLEAIALHFAFVNRGRDHCCFSHRRRGHLPAWASGRDGTKAATTDDDACRQERSGRVVQGVSIVSAFAPR